MDHQYIEEHNITDRYLLGRLRAEERSRFEEHFVDCHVCLERLETTENFRGALKTVAAEDATRRDAYDQNHAQIEPSRPSAWTWMAPFRGGWQWALIGAMLLLAALPAALWMRERGELKRRYEQSLQTSERLAREIDESQRQSAEQRRQLEAQLERESQERMRLADELEKLKPPRIAAPVFILSTVRSGDAGRPVNQIALPRSAPSIVLSLELEPDPDLQSYRATLQTSENRQVWRAGNLHPRSTNALNINLSTNMFTPGDYLLILEGLTKEGRYVPIARYSFHLTRE